MTPRWRLDGPIASGRPEAEEDQRGYAEEGDRHRDCRGGCQDLSIVILICPILPATLVTNCPFLLQASGCQGIRTPKPDF